MSTFGCARCYGNDAETAWEASRHERGAALVEESHFSVRLASCTCGQAFVVVFSERIDWNGGEDDQLWLVLPVARAEAERLRNSDDVALARTLAELGSGRRFLMRSFPTGGARSTEWRDHGFAIGPHD